MFQIGKIFLGISNASKSKKGLKLNLYIYYSMLYDEIYLHIDLLISNFME